MFKLLFRMNASLPYGLLGGVVGCGTGFANVVIGSGIGHWIGAIVISGYNSGQGLRKVNWFTQSTKELIETIFDALGLYPGIAWTLIHIASLSITLAIVCGILSALLPTVQGGMGARTALFSALFSPWLFSPVILVASVTALTTIAYGSWSDVWPEWPSVILPAAFSKSFKMLVMYPLIGIYTLIGVTLGLCACISGNRGDVTNAVVAGAFDGAIIGWLLSYSWINITLVANIGAIVGLLIWRGVAVFSEVRQRGSLSLLLWSTGWGSLGRLVQRLFRWLSTSNSARRSQPKSPASAVTNCPSCGAGYGLQAQFCAVCGTRVPRSSP